MLPDQKLDALVIRHAALERDLAAALPAETYVKLSREFAELAPVVDAVRSYRAAQRAMDERNVILEIRAGTGGDEAALFAGNLFRMYERYAAKQGWKVEIVAASDGSMGGYKEIIAEIRGRGAFARLKFESGVHRVQR